MRWRAGSDPPKGEYLRGALWPRTNHPRFALSSRNAAMHRRPCTTQPSGHSNIPPNERNPDNPPVRSPGIRKNDRKMDNPGTTGYHRYSNMYFKYLVLLEGLQVLGALLL